MNQSVIGVCEYALRGTDHGSLRCSARSAYRGHPLYCVQTAHASKQTYVPN